MTVIRPIDLAVPDLFVPDLPVARGAARTIRDHILKGELPPSRDVVAKHFGAWPINDATLTEMVMNRCYTLLQGRP